MKIVIIGDGKIGSTLAEQLSREGHEITIIDRSGIPLQQTSEDLDILCVEGNGATYATQLEAGVDKAQLLIAATASDELNLLACLIAKKTGAKCTVARVRNPEYAEVLPLIRDDLGLSLTVNPELTCATEMARVLRIPSAIKTDTFANGHVELLKFQLPPDAPIAGHRLSELPGILRAKVLICAVERGEEGIVIPSGQFELKAGDLISFVSGMHEAQDFFRQMHLSASPIRRVLLVGGGRIAYYLAKQLFDAGMDVTILESDLSRCEQLSELLPKATVLHGDGTDEKCLLEADLKEMDAFASLTGIDEENVLMSMFVRKAFPHIKVITKINRYSFQNIIGTLDLGSVFNSRYSTSNLICRYARAMQNSAGSTVETLYKLLGGRLEALEFKVSGNSALCNAALQTLSLRKNILIACINRAGKVIIPSGQDRIEPDDSVVVITSVTGLGKLDDILER